MSINRRQRSIGMALVGLQFTLWSGGFGPISLANVQKGNRLKPNIVLIVIDDLGYGDLGAYGSRIHRTPNLDRLAREGMLFTDFHTNGPVCSPTRAALMTGQYQQRSGIENAIGFTLDEGMSLQKTTVAEVMAGGGYTCGVFGKWHLGHVSKFGPNDQGFQKSYVTNNTPDYHTHVSRVGETDWFEDHMEKNEAGYLTDLITGHSLNFMRQNKAHPFFLFISHSAVHFPFQGPSDPPHRILGGDWNDDILKYGPLPKGEFKRAYKDMLERVDESVGAVVKYLDESGLRPNTLIFITSDNGAYGWVGSNHPYRGQKTDLFEGGHRVPAIASWPGKIAPGGISSETLMTMDLAPTFISLAGLKPEKEVVFDGQNISEVLFKNARLAPRTLFWKFSNPAVQSHAVRDKEWKYVVVGQDRYLFNLAIDCTEQNDLKEVYPEVASRLEGAYGEWLAGLREPR